MCIFSSPSMPSAPSPVPAPTEQDASVFAARDSERRRRLAAASKTIATSAQGVTGAAPTAAKTLLGS